MRPGQIAVSAFHRDWMSVKLGERVCVSITPLPPHPEAPPCLKSITIEIDLYRPNTTDKLTETFIDHHDLSNIFRRALCGIIVTVDVSIMFRYKKIALQGKAVSLSVGDGATGKGYGILDKITEVKFLEASDTVIRLTPGPKQSVLDIFDMFTPVTKFIFQEIYTRYHSAKIQVRRYGQTGRRSR
jgi:hypothetical protein